METFQNEVLKFNQAISLYRELANKIRSELPDDDPDHLPSNGFTPNLKEMLDENDELINSLVGPSINGVATRVDIIELIQTKQPILLEPYWSKPDVQQVIGRAIRSDRAIRSTPPNKYPIVEIATDYENIMHDFFNKHKDVISTLYRTTMMDMYSDRSFSKKDSITLHYVKERHPDERPYDLIVIDFYEHHTTFFVGCPIGEVQADNTVELLENRPNPSSCSCDICGLSQEQIIYGKNVDEDNVDNVERVVYHPLDKSILLMKDGIPFDFYHCEDCNYDLCGYCYNNTENKIQENNSEHKSNHKLFKSLGIYGWNTYDFSGIAETMKLKLQ